MKLGSLQADLGTFSNTTQSIFYRDLLANPLLRPERTRETEYGVDFKFLSDVVAGLTWYHRRTLDQLELLNNPVGLQAVWANTASVAAHGFEATFNIPVVNTHAIRGDVAFSFSDNTSRVLDLGSAPELRCLVCNGYALGYPLGSVFGTKIIGVLDTVGTGAGNPPDGIILPQEVVRDTVRRFLGVLNPPRTYTLTPTVSFLGGRLRVSSLFDRSAGYVVFDLQSAQCRSLELCLAPLLKSTPLLIQAKYADQSIYADDFMVSGDNTRWREFNVSLDVPDRLLRWNAIHLHFSSATVSLQGRNLKLWTAYKGPDPDSRSHGLDQADAAGIPQVRGWSFRCDITP